MVFRSSRLSLALKTASATRALSHSNHLKFKISSIPPAVLPLAGFFYIEPLNHWVKESGISDSFLQAGNFNSFAVTTHSPGGRTPLARE
jgi:hypothetical protein